MPLGINLKDAVFGVPGKNIRFKIVPRLSEDQTVRIQDSDGNVHEATVGELIEIFKAALASGEVVIENG